jgi:hypothetical protein
MAQIQADPIQYGAPAGSSEMLALRKQNVKVFRHAGLGRARATAFFGGTLHYEPVPGQGAWEDADTLLRPGGGQIMVADRLPFTVTRNGVNLDLADRTTGKGIRYSLPAQGVTVSGNQISFSFAGVDWTYTITERGIKLSAVVSASLGPKAFSFPFAKLGGGVDPVVMPDGSVRGDGYVLPRPWVQRADQRLPIQCGAWTIGTGQLSFVWDDSGLPPSAYPYTLDPTLTFTVAASADDGNIGTDTTDTTYPPTNGLTAVTTHPHFYAADEKIDATHFQIWQSLMGWDTSSLASYGATVTDAVLRVFSLVATGSPDGKRLLGEWYDWGAEITVDDYTTTPGNNAYDIGTTYAGMPSPQDYDYVLTNVAGNVSVTGWTKLRWAFTAGEPTGPQNFYGISMDGSGAFPAPRLIVDFTLPSPVYRSATYRPARQWR